MEPKWLRRSHRDVDTYFAGYEREETEDPVSGRRKARYVYHGAYYIFGVPDPSYRRFRLWSAARMAGAVLAFVGAHLLGPRGTVLPYIGLPALFSIIPLVYVLLGAAGLMRAKTPRMTVREYAFGLGRMENALWVLLILWAVAAGGELVYLLIKRLFTAGELCAAGLELLAFALALIQQRRQTALLAACVQRPEGAETKKKG